MKASTKKTKEEKEPKLKEHQYVVVVQAGSLIYLTAHRCATAADAMLAASSMVMEGKRVFVARVLAEIKSSPDQWHPLFKRSKNSEDTQ